MIRYEGARGVSWRIKYADADGRQVMETVGREVDGVARKQAEAELRERLVRVERNGYRRPTALTFEAWSETWHRRGMPVHYDLHAWVAEENPSGPFAQFNPSRTCP